VTHDDQVQVIELNARFGGGYPVAHQAGANFIRLLIDQVEGQESSSIEWTDGLAMTRWDDAVFWHSDLPSSERIRPCA
jgi:carbamoyl-phosphate synthase large subunit